MRRLTPILTILLLAAAVRIINAGHWPVWTDEGWSTWAASDHQIDVILEKVAADRHPPLYFLTLSAWWSIAGDSRIVLRFLSIASGILTVAVVYRLGVDWFGRRSARYAALLLAVLNVAVYYSQEIRHYGWLMLAVSLMTLTFLRYLRYPRIRTLVGYTLSTLFMFYSLYIGVLLLIVQVGIGLLAWRGTGRQKLLLAAAWIVAGVLYVPWFIGLSRQLNILVGGIDGYPTSVDGLLAVGNVLFGGQLALTAGVYLLGTWQIVQQPARTIRWLSRMTLVLSGIGLLGLMFIVNRWIGVLSARTLVFLTPLLVLISGYGLSQINRRASAILALALIAVSLTTHEVLQPRLDYQLAAQAVAADYSPGDLVILENGWDDNAFRYELMLALGESAEPQILRTLPWVDNRKPGIPVVPNVEDRIKAQPRVWVVNWLQPSQVIPFLDQGSDGFRRVLTRGTSTGAQYKSRYADQTVVEVLFERPDLTQPPRVYGNLLALHDVQFPVAAQPGQALHVDLWWSALKSPPVDYSAGVFLLDRAGNVRSQHDGSPGSQPTSRWALNTPIFDRHTLTIPRDLPPGTYKLGVQAYWYGDGAPLLVSGDKYAIVGDVQVR